MECFPIPQTVTSPLSGSLTPKIKSIRVDLPSPFSPQLNKPDESRPKKWYFSSTDKLGLIHPPIYRAQKIVLFVVRRTDRLFFYAR
ncbi:hypothetical protein [Nostoc sp.]|uniref:hypothetical protein n=1 Tax=Nostoc sp. TaxID=1180 RepID=UPI002FF56DB9